MRAPGEYYTAYVPRVGLKPSPINEIRMTETVPAAPSSSNVSETSALLLPSSTDDSRPTHPRRSASSCSYVARAASAIACTPIAVGAIVHMSLVYSSQELLYDAQSLAVPGAHINATNAACTDNFCAGYLTNTVFQVPPTTTTFLRVTDPSSFIGWFAQLCATALCCRKLTQDVDVDGMVILARVCRMSLRTPFIFWAQRSSSSCCGRQSRTSFTAGYFQCACQCSWGCRYFSHDPRQGSSSLRCP